MSTRIEEELHNQGLNLSRALGWMGLFQPSKQSALYFSDPWAISGQSEFWNLLIPVAWGRKGAKLGYSVQSREYLENSPQPRPQGSRKGCLKEV